MSLFDLPFEEPDEPLEEQDRQPPQPKRRILTVSELTAHVRTLLEERFFEIWVEGELSNCRVWNTGHLYFTLKDATAQIKGVMFRSSLRLLRFKPQDGLARRGAWPHQRLRPEGRISDRLRAPRAGRPRRTATRLRSAEDSGWPPKVFSTRHGSVRCLPFPARSASSRRSTALQCATSSTSCAAAMRTLTW